MAEFYRPTTVSGIFMDFKGRYNALIKALTTDYRILYELCDPDKEELCLVGLPDESWQVQPFGEILDIPAPLVGINVVRTELEPLKKWLVWLALLSYSWLLSVAFFYAGYSGCDRTARKKLFYMINNFPTLFEIVSEFEEIAPCQPTLAREEKKQCLEVEDDEEYTEFCGACGKAVYSFMFWICCNFCHRGFHGDCLKITPADIIENYKCPLCHRGELYDMEKDLSYLCKITKETNNREYNQKLPILSSGENSQLESEETVEAMDEKQEGFKVKTSELQGECSRRASENVCANQFLRFCIVCQKWWPENSVVMPVDEVMEGICIFCNMKKRNAYRYKAQCEACNTNIYPKEFKVCCVVCELWYHGDCINLTRTNQYKCQCCNKGKKRYRKNMACGACDKDIAAREFKVTCVHCKLLYHGSCVNVSRSDRINKYSCPSCNLNRL